MHNLGNISQFFQVLHSVFCLCYPFYYVLIYPSWFSSSAFNDFRWTLNNIHIYVYAYVSNRIEFAILAIFDMIHPVSISPHRQWELPSAKCRDSSSADASKIFDPAFNIFRYFSDEFYSPPVIIHTGEHFGCGIHFHANLSWPSVTPHIKHLICLILDLLSSQAHILSMKQIRFDG